MSYMKGVRQGSEGNTSLLKSYGGGSSGPRQGYATGGSVGLNKDGPALSEGLSAAGTPAKPSLARPGRKVGKKKDAKTNINVIVAPSAPKEGPPPMPPMAGPPPGPPPMPPPGAGAPPPGMPPMRASGGRVGYKVGGRVKKAEGGRISGDSEREIERLDRDTPRSLGNVKALTMGVGAGAALAKGMPRPVRALGALVGAAGAKGTYDDTMHAGDNIYERERIRKGLVEPGKEDRKSGGRVGYKIGKVKKRADGGSTISADSKKEAAVLRERASGRAGNAGMHAAMSTLGLGTQGMPRFGRMLGKAVIGSNLLAGGNELVQRSRENAEADRIERGQPEPGKEDRKSGGKVCRAEGGPVGGLSNEDGGAGGASGRLEKIKMYGK